MKKMLIGVLSLVAVGSLALAQESKTHIAVPPTGVKWGPPPPSLSKGAQFAVVSGDPTKAGPFAI